MLKSIGDILVYLPFTCLTISIIIVLVSWKRLPILIHLLSYFLIWNFLIELGAYICIQLSVNNLPLLHMYTLGEMILWSLFYREALLGSQKRKKGEVIFLLTIITLLIINSLFIQEITGFNSYAKTLVNLIILIYGILYLIKLLETKKTKNQIGRLSFEIINFGVLIYYSGSLLVFMFSDYFLTISKGLHIGFWVFNVLLNLIFQILMLFAIWKASSKKRYIS